MRHGVVDGGSRLALALAGAGLLAALSGRPLAAQLGCNASVEHFDAGIGNGWTVRDHAGAGVKWQSTAACGEANFTGGSGGAACVSSDRAGLAEFSTELRSPMFSLASAQTASLSFRANYQNFSRTDTLELDISTDGGVTWANLLRWKEDHGAFRDLEGETTTVDLSAYAGRTGLILRWHYRDPGTGDFAWYAQVDDVQLRCDLEAPCPPESTTAALADGGFEGGTPSAAWTEASSNFGSPICESASCGFAGARTGSGWAFFGGAAAPEAASLTQNLPLAAGIAKLSFYLWAPAAGGNAIDALRVLLDGQQVFQALEQETAYRQDYLRIARDLSAFADGASHELRFAVLTSGQPAHTNFFVDDVSVSVCTAVVENPEIRISDVVLEEGNAGAFDAVFTVSLSGASRLDVSLDFVTAGGTAEEGSDYLSRAGRLVFSPGTRVKTIAVPIVGDIVDEQDETFYVRLSGASNGTIADSEGLGTIRNDDQTWIAITDGAALEQDGAVTTAVFTAGLSRPSNRPILVDYRTVDETATAGRDYVSLAGTLSFPPGATRQTLTVQVSDDRVVERDETFRLILNNPLNAAIEREQGNGTIIDNDRGRYPVEGTDVLYTIDNDFDQGRLLNLTYETAHDQLQLTRTLSTYPYLWAAASDRGTLVKVDTRTGTVLGEYSTSPDQGAAAAPNPSRTTVGLDGSVWAGNRGDGSVIHVGLVEAGQCIDRNGSGAIETSQGYGDILAWPNLNGEDTAGGVSTAQDECVLHYTRVSASVVRHLSVDRDNNVWVSGLGGVNDHVFDLVDGTSGGILRTEGPLACGGYGGLVDRNGVLWSATYNGPVLRWNPTVLPPNADSLRCLTGVASYGLGIDPTGNVWVASPSGDRVWRISGDDQTVSGPYRHGSPAAQGIAVGPDGDVWVSSAKWGGSATIGHLKGDGRFVGSVTGVPIGSSGVAVDAAGKVWTANAAASSLSRIDPRAGPIGADGDTHVGLVDLTVPLPGANPYNYSDMTGSLALASTSPQGTWQVIQDARAAETEWGTISWNREPQGSVPPEGAIEVEARAAESEAGLGERPFMGVVNGAPFALAGRFLQVRVTVRPAPGGLSPVLSDLRIQAKPGAPPDLATLSVANTEVFEGNSGALDAIFTVTLSTAVAHSVSVSYATEEGSALPGADFTARSATLTLPAGTTTATVTVPIVGDSLPEEAEFFFLRLSSPSGAILGDALGVATIVDNDRRVEPVESRDRLYTFDDDFELGRLFNTHHDAPDQHQLQVSRELTTFPYLWIAASARGTLVKIDTRTGTILGEFSTNPDVGSSGYPDPSRTTVALDGSVWAGNRQDGSVIHVGLLEEGQCVDRNGNGAIETSKGYGDILPWPNPGNVNSAGGVSAAWDECLLHYVKVSAQSTRHLSVDTSNNLWVSGRHGANNAVFNYLDGQSGQILRTEGPFPCGGYGGLIDRAGILWSTNQQGPVLRWDPSVQPATPQSFKCIPKFFDWRYSYGAAADSQGNIWVTGLDGNLLWKIPPDGSQVLGPFPHGSYYAQGLAIDKRDHIWVSSALHCCTGTVGHVLPDGTFLGNVTGVPFGSTGVAIDSRGKIWTANILASSASRIDPSAGPVGSDGVTPVGAVDLVVPLPGANPYNYSDMTGFLALQKTLPRGTWHVIQDGGIAGISWGRITWNTESQGSEPLGTSILVEVRAADTVAGLGGLPFVPVANGAGFSAIGRFLEVRVILRPNALGTSPVLSDIRIETADFALPQITIGDVEVEEGNTGSVLATFTARLSAPADREIRVDFSTADGDAAAASDYVAAASTAVFPPGTTSQSIAVPVRGDVLDELDEQFFLNLERPVNGVIADGQAVGRILDDDAPVLLSVSDVSVEEGDFGTTSAVFRITLSATPGHTVTVDYRTADGTARAGADYRLTEGYLVFPQGVNELLVSVQVLGDTLAEEDESFTLNLINPVGAAFASAQGHGSIIDDDGIQLSINDIEVTEGNTGTTEATFILSASSPARETATVRYATAAGTATEELDYIGVAGTATLNPGETSTSITVRVRGDLVLEPDEEFTLNLTDPINALLIDATGVATIRDDERCAGPSLLVNGGAEERLIGGDIPGWQEVEESSWTRRSGEVGALEGARYLGANDGEIAELRQDVSLAPYVSQIAAGSQRFAFEGFVRSLPEVPADTARIVVEYRNAANAQVLDSFDSSELASTEAWQRLEDVRVVPTQTRWARVRLIATRYAGASPDALFDGLSLRSRRASSLTATDATVYEGDSGLREAVFQVRLSCAVQSSFTASYETADGTARAGEDYVATAGTLTFPPGSANETVPVPVIGDEVNEPHEMFTLALYDPVGAPVVLVDPQGLGTIVNDDACPRSPGYWKAHPEAWSVEYLVLGGVEYEPAALLSFLSNSSPDASLILARQLVAAKLNLAVGSKPTILATGERADSWLETYPPGSNPEGAARDEALAIKDVLDAYNNGGCAP